jgi:hypothetical protein
MIKQLLIGREHIYSGGLRRAAALPGAPGRGPAAAGNDKTGEAGALARPATEWR